MRRESDQFYGNATSGNSTNNLNNSLTGTNTNTVGGYSGYQQQGKITVWVPF